MQEPAYHNLNRITARGPLAPLVYGELKRAITQGIFPPGTLLPEDRLTEALGASRTPVREALNRLTGDGLVVILPRKGAKVVELTARELDDLFEAREVIETAFFVRAARSIPREEYEDIRSGLAEAERSMEDHEHLPETWKEKQAEYLQRDRAFHDRLVKASGNLLWVSVYHSIRDRIEVHSFSTSARYPAFFARAVEEHHLILDALVEGEWILARRLMTDHIRNFRTRIS